MLRRLIQSPILLTVALGLLSAAPPLNRCASAAETASDNRNEWVGLEVSPLLFGQSLGTAKAGWNDEREFQTTLQLGSFGTLRLLRLNRERYYWTPMQMTLGTTYPQERLSIPAMISTEVGARWKLAGGSAVEFGTAAGAGVILIDYGLGLCDGSCLVGGYGALLSPVFRWRAAHRGRFQGGFVSRALVPLLSPDPRSFQARGFGVLFGVEIAVH